MNSVLIARPGTASEICMRVSSSFLWTSGRYPSGHCQLINLFVIQCIESMSKPVPSAPPCLDTRDLDPYRHLPSAQGHCVQSMTSRSDGTPKTHIDIIEAPLRVQIESAARGPVVLSLRNVIMEPKGVDYVQPQSQAPPSLCYWPPRSPCRHTSLPAAAYQQ